MKNKNDNLYTPPFWHMHTSPKAGNKILKSLNNKNKINFINESEVVNSFTGAPVFFGPGPSKIARIKSCPTPIIKVSEKNLTPSIFLFSPEFYSERFRKALDLSFDKIQYIDIDASKSVVDFIEAGYKMAHILCVGDVFDLKASGFEQYAALDENGRDIVGWRPKTENGLPIIGAVRFVFRNDPSTPSDLFYSRWTGQLMATDELAERVLQSGIDDVHFQDITFVDPEHKLVRLKTADGIHVVDYASFSK